MFNFVSKWLFYQKTLNFCLLTLIYKDHIFLKSATFLGVLWKFMAHNKHHKAKKLT
jgi:hypothetical protein